jgi:hypothetical protein
VQGSVALAPGGEGEIMASPKFVEIEGKRFLWRELLQRRRDQLMAVGKTEQPKFVRAQGGSQVCA